MIIGWGVDEGLKTTTACKNRILTYLVKQFQELGRDEGKQMAF